MNDVVCGVVCLMRFLFVHMYIVDTFDFIVFPVFNTAFVDCAIENSVTF